MYQTPPWAIQGRLIRVMGLRQESRCFHLCACSVVLLPVVRIPAVHMSTLVRSTTTPSGGQPSGKPSSRFERRGLAQAQIQEGGTGG